jgi:hypothetical protein
VAEELGSHLSDAAYREAEAILEARGTVEDVLRHLKANGANAIASIRALERLLGLTVPEAQQALAESETWSDMHRRGAD